MEHRAQKQRYTLAKALHELKEHSAWKMLESELVAIRETLDRKILSTPLAQTDNTLRYTRHDLERETRRIIANFLELPDDLISRLEGWFESDGLKFS